MLAYPFRVKFWCQWFIITELHTKLARRAEFVLREDFPLYGDEVA